MANDIVPFETAQFAFPPFQDFQATNTAHSVSVVPVPERMQDRCTYRKTGPFYTKFVCCNLSKLDLSCEDTPKAQ